MPWLVPIRLHDRAGPVPLQLSAGVLARLARLMLRQNFLDGLRAAATPSETFQLIEEAERELIG